MVKEYLNLLQNDGQVIVDDFDFAQQIYNAASSHLIGKRGVFGMIIQQVRIGAALPVNDADRTGYKITAF